MYFLLKTFLILMVLERFQKKWHSFESIFTTRLIFPLIFWFRTKIMSNIWRSLWTFLTLWLIWFILHLFLTFRTHFPTFIFRSVFMFFQNITFPLTRLPLSLFSRVTIFTMIFTLKTIQKTNLKVKVGGLNRMYYKWTNSCTNWILKPF